MSIIRRKRTPTEELAAIKETLNAELTSMRLSFHGLQAQITETRIELSHLNQLINNHIQDLPRRDPDESSSLV